MRDRLGLSLDLELMLGAAAVSGTPSPYAGYLLADDFDSTAYWRNGVRYDPITTLPGYAFTATGTASELNSDGTIAGPFGPNVAAITDEGLKARQAFTNLLLNAGSATVLATQSVTVTAVAHTISFIGTGSVTLSGVATGTLTGTSATNRVTLDFTPTAGALTVTVTGSVTYATLYAVAAAGPIIATTTTAATRGEANLSTNIYANGTALADQDMLVFVRGEPTGALGSPERFGIHLGTTTEYIILKVHQTSSLVTGLVRNAAGIIYNAGPAGAIVADQVVTSVLRRLGGNWRAGKYVAGVLTWAAETAGAFPVGLTKATVGNISIGGAPFRGTIHDARILPGTYTTDAEVTAALEATMPEPLVAAVLGDSTIAAFSGTIAVPDYIYRLGATNIADPGDTIEQQRTLWNALGSYAKYKAVIVQVGLNDMAQAIGTTLDQYQSLINDIAADAPQAAIYASQMIPAGKRWFDVYGYAGGLAAYQRWLDLNAAIAGLGATPITGVHGRITSHVPRLAETRQLTVEGNTFMQENCLALAYDTGDAVHPNNKGRQINAAEWRGKLVADGRLA